MTFGPPDFLLMIHEMHHTKKKSQIVVTQIMHRGQTPSTSTYLVTQLTNVTKLNIGDTLTRGQLDEYLGKGVQVIIL
jgi:hypothetical protein